MNKHLQSLTLFTHASFFPRGLAFTSPSAGTIAQETWPDASDTLWDNNAYKLGILENFKMAPTANEAVIKTGIPGGLVDVAVHEVGREQKITFDAVQLTSQALQLMFGGWVSTGDNSVQTSTVEFAPQKGRMIRDGIFAFASYDEDNVLIVSGNEWCALKVTNVEPMSGANTFKCSFEARVLWSTNNKISTPAAA